MVQTRTRHQRRARQETEHTADMHHDKTHGAQSLTHGKVSRLVWARGLGKEIPDDVCFPRNPFAYASPCMGNSIGASLDGEEVTATLGPCVTAQGGDYRLASFHPFVNANHLSCRIFIEHPSLTARSRTMCMLAATSGFNLKTTRVVHDPYWEDNDKELPPVVTDWILISAETQQANILRKFPRAAGRPERSVTCTSSVPPTANVIRTERTSRIQRGQVCEIPAYLDGVANGTSKATREWFAEEPFASDNEDDWIKGSIGVEGDSGAAIVDSDTNTLVGRLRGQNAILGSRAPGYILHADCRSIRLYTREARHVGSAPTPSGPRRGRSRVRLPRLEEPYQYVCNDSVGSQSPNMQGLYPLTQAASPDAPELRSPYSLGFVYPESLSEEDLCESSCPQPSKVALGKRPVVPPAQEQGHVDKRRRFTCTSTVQMTQ
ncbi:hypothetical protein GGR50DRAFT_692399 [Xylaria sp. CBS 124048]|nr:hypothetical protein GGR50DRAFT_692399 [Xylaria sp. CBS 124048]